MRHSVNILSVFTDETAAVLGNPAGVVISDAWLPDAEMAALAKHIAKPMTAFLFPLDDSQQNYNVRYYDFTGQENHICGHATMAGASHLFRKSPHLHGKTVEFHLNPAFFDGEKKVLKAYLDKGGDVSLDLFQSHLRTELSSSFCNIAAEALRIEPGDITSAAFSTNIKDYVVSVNSYKTLMRIQPQFELLEKMAASGEFQHQGLMITSLAPEGSGYDFCVRAFLSVAGIEDIACGSANCSIIPFWYDKGLNVEARKYKALFPYPPGAKAHIGGVQRISYDHASGNIRLTAQTRYEGELIIGSCYSRPCVDNQLHFI